MAILGAGLQVAKKQRLKDLCNCQPATNFGCLNNPASRKVNILLYITILQHHIISYIISISSSFKVDQKNSQGCSGLFFGCHLVATRLGLKSVSGLVGFDEIAALRIALQQGVVGYNVHLRSLLDHRFHFLVKESVPSFAI